MKITINSHTIIIIPTAFIINNLASGIIRKKLKNNGIKITRKQISTLTKAIKLYKRTHSEWNITEVFIKEKNVVLKIKL